MANEKFFKILKDGKWHTLTNLSDQIHVKTDKLTEFSQFLSNHGIIFYDSEAQRIKIDPKWQDLLPDEIEPQ